MKKILRCVVPVKSFAALIFTGLICLYMVTGSLGSTILNIPFDYTIPFVFALQGLVLAILISILRVVLLGDGVIKKMRYFPRLMIFSISLMALLAACLLVFLAIPTAWAKLWLIVAGCITAGVVVLSILGEMYFKATGKRYTEILNEYKSKIT